MRLLIGIIFSTLLLWAGNVSDSAQKHTTTHHEQQIIADAKRISQHYQEFIDTPPSKQKKALAITLKEEIETFQARYEGSKLIKPALELLVEVDDYLDSN